MKRSVKLRHRSSSCRDLPLLCIAVVAAGLLAACAQVPGRVHKISPAVSGEPLVYMSDDGGILGFLAGRGRSAGHPTAAAEHAACSRVEQARSSGSERATLAYTLLGRNSSDPDHEAQIWLLNLEDRQTVLFVAGVDLRSALVWSADSSSIAVRAPNWHPGRDLGAVVRSRSGVRRRLPAGAEPDPVRLRAGRDLARRAVRPRRHRYRRCPARGRATGPARQQWRGSRSSSLRMEDAPPSFSTTMPPAPSSGGGTVDLRTGATARLPHRWGEIIGVAWTAANRLTAGSTGMAAGIRDESGDVVVASRDGGFDQPLAWSPSGRYLRRCDTSGGKPAGIRARRPNW